MIRTAAAAHHSSVVAWTVSASSGTPGTRGSHPPTCHVTSSSSCNVQIHWKDGITAPHPTIGTVLVVHVCEWWCAVVVQYRLP